MIEPAHMQEAAELLPKIVTGINVSATGMLLFTQAKKIRRKADLSFDLLFAVTEVVIGDNRDHHPARITRGQIESTAVIVRFLGLLPAHPILPLTGSGLVVMGKTELLFSDSDQMRSEDDATRVARPMMNIQSRVVLLQ